MHTPPVACSQEHPPQGLLLAHGGIFASRNVLLSARGQEHTPLASLLPSQEHPHLASLLPTLEYIELDTGCAAALEGCTGAHPHSQSAPKRHGIDAARVICHVSHQMRARCGYGKGACGAVVGLMDGGGAHSSLVDGKGADVSLVPGKGAGVGLVNEQVEVANGDGVPKGQNLGPGSAEG
eukprot:scaffold19317_cov20-Tisochrysis_lutea.AAC.3